MAFIGTAAAAAASRNTTRTPGVSLKKLSPNTSAKNKRVLSALFGKTPAAQKVAEKHYGKLPKKGGRKRRTSKKCSKHKHKHSKHKHSKHKHSKHTRKCRH